jgi:DNA-binding GntR family transcriptional regulator
MAPLEAIIDRMADVLREAIVTNTLKPGTRLRADDLAGKLGVSKTPVREALRKLQAEALITVQAGNVLTVKSITEQELLEIYYTREALEGMAARLAAENAGTLDLANLRAIVDEIKACRSNLRRMRTLTGDFQLLVFRAARNDTIYCLLRHLQEQIRQFGGTTLSLFGISTPRSSKAPFFQPSRRAASSAAASAAAFALSSAIALAATIPWMSLRLSPCFLSTLSS